MNLYPRFGALAAIAALAFSLPLAAAAQQAPPNGSTPRSGTIVGHPHARQGPPLLRAMRTLNLSETQRTQMRGILRQFRAAHPKGSPKDPAGRKAMRQQLLGVLSPEQRAQFKTQMRAMYRARHNAGARKNPPGNGNAVFPSDTSSPSPRE